MAWHCRVENIQAFLDGELDDRQRQECEAHLAGCEYCARLMRRLGAVSDAVAAAGPAEPPADLRESIFEAVAQAGPVPELSCESATAMSSAYLDGELPKSDRDALEAHLFACPSCYRAFKRMEMGAEALRAEPPAPVPADLHRRVVAAVERERRAVGVLPVFPRWRTAVGIAAGLAAAAAVIAALVLPRAGQPEPSGSSVGSVAVLPEAAETVAARVEEETDNGGQSSRPGGMTVPIQEPARSDERPHRPVVARHVTRDVHAESAEEARVPDVAPPATESVAEEPAEREVPAEDAAPVVTPVEPMLARAERSASVAPVGELEGGSPEPAGVLEPATTAPAVPGPVAEPVLAALPETARPTPAVDSPPEAVAEPTPTTRAVPAAGATVTWLRRGDRPAADLPAPDPEQRCAAETAKLNASLRPSRRLAYQPGVSF